MDLRCEDARMRGCEDARMRGCKAAVALIGRPAATRFRVACVADERVTSANECESGAVVKGRVVMT